MAEITWTSEAERWLKKIFDYIATDNPDAALKVVNGIHQRTQIPKIQPKIGYIYEH